ncbi:Ig-like domain-containing protein [Aquiflexum sp. TKW24L]|uniref:glucoamylase family protein n=1 Tax=Aquiflexum sp. TKW24L TaxID=2942212 RepID=UPI0020C0D1E8|nr:glucoamylase family protein [Aquiflexum sp. TKW24L]MCL6259887.1 Ig-like domain-containing protein [Aquiflexum sp. TKW24L]
MLNDKVHSDWKRKFLCTGNLNHDKTQKPMARSSNEYSLKPSLKSLLFFLLYIIVFSSCEKDEPEASIVALQSADAGGTAISLVAPISENIPLDRPITLIFSAALEPTSVANSISLFDGDQLVTISTSLISNNRNIVIYPVGLLKNNTVYRIGISNSLKSANQSNFVGQEISFKTVFGGLQIVSLTIQDSEQTKTARTVNVPLDFSINIEFNAPVNRELFQSGVRLLGREVPNLQFTYTEADKNVAVSGLTPLQDLSKYTFELANTIKGVGGESYAGSSKIFYTRSRDNPFFPVISDEALLTKVQEQTFRYFWDFAHPNSGMARERNTSGNLVTVGGSGFGVMTILVGIERDFISRQQGVERLNQIVDFLVQADRFHGVWPHWLDGNTGKVIPFSEKDNGGDLVETAFMIQGLLTAKAYLNASNPLESAIINKITQLWHEVEWDWYTRGGQNILYWHWSPIFNWEMNLPIRGYNESLIVYVLAAASPTHPINPAVYHQGWANNGAMRNGNLFYQIPLPLGYDFGGPLFFSHYSFLGLDPRKLSDQYADYSLQNRNHSLINQAHAISNPLGFAGYSEDSWGFTASDNHLGYNAHSPTNDLGVITPTAALGSMPFTPVESMKALRFFYYKMGDRLWGQYGFYDAFNITEQWYADSFLAIDQGPIVIMIENHRTALLWDLFMKDTEVKAGLDRLNFTY